MYKRNNGGITLIGLIVTIIILLILAGISIATLTDSGLFSNAQKAKEEQENAQSLEDTILADYENKINEYIKGGRETVTLSKEQYDELVGRLSAVETDLKSTKTELANTKTELSNSNTRISELENETIVNKRINLMNTVQRIPISTTLSIRDYEIELSDSIENYKYLEIQLDILAKSTSGAHAETTLFIATNQLNYNNSNTVNWANESSFPMEVTWMGNTQACAGVNAWFKNNKLLHIGYSETSHSDWEYLRIKNIYGIK